ncbi:hypothetical protein AAC03nite_10960 [Alicyclobacillus acidoterrestris]|nr:hypothetical protein AAC03nite_10960 [Alicyclobacillus acidoterrestris]
MAVCNLGLWTVVYGGHPLLCVGLLPEGTGCALADVIEALDLRIADEQ